jgi:hypothetical protein
MKKKIEVIDINKKKEGQILQDISLTPGERFVRMFDLIEFGFAFSSLPKVMEERIGMTVFTLRKNE